MNMQKKVIFLIQTAKQLNFDEHEAFELGIYMGKLNMQNNPNEQLNNVHIHESRHNIAFELGSGYSSLNLKLKSG